MGCHIGNWKDEGNSDVEDLVNSFSALEGKVLEQYTFAKVMRKILFPSFKKITGWEADEYRGCNQSCNLASNYFLVCAFEPMNGFRR